MVDAKADIMIKAFALCLRGRNFRPTSYPNVLCVASERNIGKLIHLKVLNPGMRCVFKLIPIELSIELQYHKY